MTTTPNVMTRRVVDTATAPLLEVEGLGVRSADTGAPVVSDVSFSLRNGTVLGLVGESGSGKTTVAHSLLGYARRGLEISDGRVRFRGKDVLTASFREIQDLRGRSITYVAQDPGSALSPALRLRTQLRDVLVKVPGLHRAEIDQRMQELLADVRLDGRNGILDAYPHQLSGGQQQRFMLAMAFACRPDLIILDEPTTGLDVTTQRHVLDTLKRLISANDCAAVYVSHDLAVVDEVADEVGVMLRGRLVELGPTAEVFRKPQHPYTQQLLRAHHLTTAPPGTVDAPPTGDTALEIRGLKAFYASKEVVHGVDLSVSRQSCVAIVGESGAGKSTLARSISGLQSDWSGSLSIGGTDVEPGRKRSRELHRTLQFIFQNPYSSLNPRKTVQQIVEQWLEELTDVPRREWRARVVQALKDAALDEKYLRRYPHQLSGGQRQRVAIARALVVEPSILVCDEITSALDVSAQAAIIELLRTLRRAQGVTVVLITHDIPVVRALADDILILRSGSVEEHGPSALTTPESDYGRRLLADVPKMNVG